MELMIGSSQAGAGVVTLMPVTGPWGWQLVTDIIIRSIGAAGAIEAHGRVGFFESNDEIAAHVSSHPTATVDTTADRDLTLRVSWGTAHANNTIQMRSLVVEQLA
jgi:hypothetical protein